MGMDLGGGGGPKSEINVTPLVDVVLVLLIIFMVVQPLLQMGYDVQVPPNAPPTTSTALAGDVACIKAPGFETPGAPAAPPRPKERTPPDAGPFPPPLGAPRHRSRALVHRPRAAPPRASRACGRIRADPPRSR